MKKRILIIEDERHIGIGLRFNCEAEGYAAVLVEDGPSAVKLVEQAEDPFDLIILDLMLPGMSGYAVLEKLRGMGTHIPVLILSARTLSEDKVRGFDLGADQYMTKPFELAELISRVRVLIARHAQVRGDVRHDLNSAEDVFRFNSAVINFTRHEVTVRDEKRQLTPLELKLLKCFVENDGIVLTRNELLDRVWGLDATPVSRTVDNFILRLRQHFEDDAANPRHFLSVRGAGYRFVANPGIAESGDEDPTQE